MRALASAAGSVFAGADPYRAYGAVNRLQRDWRPTLDAAFATTVRDRLKFRLLGHAQAFLVQEGMLAQAGAATSGYLPLPGDAHRYWVHPPVSGRASRRRFTLLLLQMYLAGLRRFMRLVRNGRRGTVTVSRPYVVVVHAAATMVLGAAAGEGFLGWLRNRSPLAGVASDVWLHTSNATQAPPADPTLHMVDEVFPRLPTPAARLAFLFTGLWLLVVTAASALVGRWQRVVLLEDLQELAYLRALPERMLAKGYVFTLADQADRPLWTWYAETAGAITPLLYYASSYTLFHYGGQVVDEVISHPALVANQWTRCWFQSPEAAASLGRVLPRCIEAKVVGAFDMTYAPRGVPPLPPRSVVVFDVEPIASPLRVARAGYLVPYLREQVVIEFWRALAGAARTLDLVLVHKPKRPNPTFREWRYRATLERLAAEGRYRQLPAEVGPRQLMREAAVAIALPFTSIADLAPERIGCAFAYLDVRATIADPERHANGARVLRGERDLMRWLAARFDVSPVLRHAEGGR